MTRALYRCLLWLHPPVFRREFSGEMLWIFDEAAQSGTTRPLFSDAFISLARQWCLRSGYWKYAVVTLGAVLQTSIGGVLLLGIAQDSASSDVSSAANPQLAVLMRLTALTAIGLLAAVMLLVFCWRSLARRSGV
jgi:hypothetical protein